MENKPGIICPTCHHRVTPQNGKCPICGETLNQTSVKTTKKITQTNNDGKKVVQVKKVVVHKKAAVASDNRIMTRFRWQTLGILFTVFLAFFGLCMKMDYSVKDLSGYTFGFHIFGHAKIVDNAIVYKISSTFSILGVLSFCSLLGSMLFLLYSCYSESKLMLKYAHFFIAAGLILMFFWTSAYSDGKTVIKLGSASEKFNSNFYDLSSIVCPGFWWYQFFTFFATLTSFGVINDPHNKEIE